MSGFPLQAILSGDRSKFEIIPLGTNCHISHSLRQSGLRFSALPFDWNVTPIQSAITLIDNDFSEFLAPENLQVLPSTLRLLFDENGIELEMKDDVITPVLCTKYNMLFPHDYPEDYNANTDAVARKYQKRIERFRTLLNSDKHLIFVHHEGALNEWQQQQYTACHQVFVNRAEHWQAQLGAVLSRRFPQLAFSCHPYQQFVTGLNTQLQLLRKSRPS